MQGAIILVFDWRPYDPGSGDIDQSLCTLVLETQRADQFYQVFLIGFRESHWGWVEFSQVPEDWHSGAAGGLVEKCDGDDEPEGFFPELLLDEAKVGGFGGWDRADGCTFWRP